MLRKAALLLIGAVIATLMLEVVLRVLPTPTLTRSGRHVDPYVTSYPPDFTFETATGWSLLNAVTQRSGPHGFIPFRELDSTPEAVALIGDSLVEQSMLVPDDRLASILETMRSGLPVYSLGFPGSSLFDYLERIRFARERLGLENFIVIIEGADVQQSTCSGSGYTDACVDAQGKVVRVATPDRSRLRDFLSHSALLQYFVGVLRLSPAKLLGSFSAEATISVDPQKATRRVSQSGSRLTAVEERAIEKFMAELVKLRAIGLRVALVIDPRISAIEREQEFLDPALERIFVAARTAEVPVIHPLRALQRLRKASGFEMHVGPYDKHWNRRANCAIALEILRSGLARSPSTNVSSARGCPGVSEEQVESEL